MAASATGGMDSPHVQVKFFTKQTQFSVPSSQFSVPANVGVKELSSLINSLLQPDSGDKKTISFDFLASGELLRLPLDEFITQKGITAEEVIELEYLERCPAPQPEDSLQHDDWVSAVRAVNDFILTGSYDNVVRIWNTEGDLITSIPGHNGPVKCLSWVKQDEDNAVHVFVSGSHDETLLLWEWNQQKNSIENVRHCRGHAGSVDTVSVDPTKNRFCSGSWDKMIKIWSAVPNPEAEDDEDDNGEKPTKKKKIEASKAPTRVPIMTMSGHNEGVSSLVWLSDAELCSASWDHSIRLWDVNQARETALIAGSKVFLNISYSQHNRTLLAASADRHIRLYDPRITDGAVVRCTFTSHTAWVSCVAWSPVDEHQFISGGYDNLLKLWDTRSSKAPLYDMSGHEDKILACDWSMPQYMMSGGADNHLKIFSSGHKPVHTTHL